MRFFFVVSYSVSCVLLNLFYDGLKYVEVLSDYKSTYDILFQMIGRGFIVNQNGFYRIGIKACIYI